ncbi:MAG: hypothetical protein HY217_10065 [Candidatus Rokubacteria bacterium]|nr:hypothetical protein [Candidatus Rokubacteria bacterium]
MATVSRALLGLGALLLLLVFFFPLWRYDLAAPQYPEGITMTIWVNKLGGQLALVNGLNHYIGMAIIDPDAFAELRFMPWIVAAMCAAGAVAALAGRLPLALAWVGAFGLSALVGLADFYRWLYQFGHNLDPGAPIQVEPFTPPLIGPKTVMNFEVTTYPDAGGLAMILALLLGVAAVVVELRRRRRAAG